MYPHLGSLVAAPGAYSAMPGFVPATGYPQFRPTTFGAPMGSFVAGPQMPQMGSFVSAAPRVAPQMAVPGMSGSPIRYQTSVPIADMGSFVAPPMPAAPVGGPAFFDLGSFVAPPPAVMSAPTILRDLGSFVAPPMSSYPMDLGSFVAPPMTSRPVMPIARPTITYAAPAAMASGPEYRYCPECGAENPAKAKCCMECGSKMGDATTYTDAPAPVQPAATYAAPSIYATASYGGTIVRTGSMVAAPMATTYGTLPPVMYTSASTSNTYSPSKPAAPAYSQAAENVTGVDI